MTKIFVGGIDSSEVKETDLKELFSRHGKVEECVLIRDYAFVHMASPEEAQDCITKLNGAVLKSCRLKVLFSNNPHSRDRHDRFYDRLPPPYRGPPRDPVRFLDRHYMPAMDSEGCDMHYESFRDMEDFRRPMDFPYGRPMPYRIDRDYMTAEPLREPPMSRPVMPMEAPIENYVSNPRPVRYCHVDAKGCARDPTARPPPEYYFRPDAFTSF